VDSTPLHWLDLAVIVVYLTVVVGIGLYFMRRQKSTKEYLLAGRSVGWFEIGFSLLASLNSAVDYVIGPAQIIEFGFLNLVLWLRRHLLLGLLHRPRLRLDRLRGVCGDRCCHVPAERV